MTTKRFAAPTSTQAAPSVYAYTDYRAFLRDIMKHRRRFDPRYSLQKFSKQLGFSSHAGLAMVLSGKRELKAPYLDRCIRNLHLNTRERIHFETMVRSQHLGPKARTQLLKQVELLVSHWEPPRGADATRLMDYLLIQQVLNLYRPAAVDLPTIHNHFRYRISLSQIREGLDWLIGQDLVEQQGERYRSLKSVFMLKDELPSEEGRQLHKDFMRLAQNALDQDPVEAREFQTFVVSVDSKHIPEIKQRIKKAAIEIASEFETELEADTLVEFHFNMFEVTNRVRRK